MIVVQFLLCKGSLKETRRNGGRLRWFERGMIIVAHSSRSSALLQDSHRFLFFFIPPCKKHAALSRDTGPERTGSPSGRVIKPGAMHTFSETSRWNANTRVGMSWEEGCVPEGKEESPAPEFVKFLTAPPVAGCILRHVWRDAPADLWRSLKISPWPRDTQLIYTDTYLRIKYKYIIFNHYIKLFYQNKLLFNVIIYVCINNFLSRYFQCDFVCIL